MHFGSLFGSLDSDSFDLIINSPVPNWECASMMVTVGLSKSFALQLNYDLLK